MKKEIKEWVISTIIAVLVLALIVGFFTSPKIALVIFVVIVLIGFIVFVKDAIFNKKIFKR